jgi:hypothetical protein
MDTLEDSRKPNPVWTQQELARLTLLAGEKAKAAKVLGRRVSSVRRQARGALSCCRFDGQLVKLIPPCARTQQG